MPVIDKGICHKVYIDSSVYLRVELYKEVSWYGYSSGVLPKEEQLCELGEESNKIEEWFQRNKKEMEYDSNSF